MEAVISIHNVLHIKQAEVYLESGTITAIRGPNASGKTSTALVIGALMTGASNPLAVGRGQGQIYLREGADAGFAELHINQSPVRKWDVAADDLTEFTTAPNVPVTEGAVGLIDFTALMTAPVRTTLWEAYFLPPPETLHDLIAKQLVDLVQPAVFDRIMEEIRGGKLDDIVKSYAERARRAKADWTKVTGETWGKAKGADWLPDGWLSELDGITSDDMVVRVQEARDQLHIMQRDSAISAAEITRAAEAAERLPALEQTFEEVKAEHAAAAAKIAEMETQRIPLVELVTVAREGLKTVRHNEPKDHSKHTLTCPDCGGQLVMHAGELRSYDEEAVEAVRQEWETKLTEAQQNYDMMSDSLAEAERQIAVAKTETTTPLQARLDTLQAEIGATKRLAALATVAPADDNTEKVEAQETLIEKLVNQHSMVLSREAAHIHNRNVLDYTTVATQLGPKGVRSTALKGELTKLDTVLNTVSGLTGWPRVTLDQTYAVGIGDRRVMRVCAESERLRAQYCLQIGLARVKREAVIVLDKVDHLDPGNQRSLFDLLKAMLGRADPPAVLVCGTELDTRHLNPDGTNYRLDDGVLVPDDG